MPLIKMKIASEKSEEIIEAIFDDNEIELINEFQEEVSRMLTLDVFKKSLNVSWNIESEIGQAPIIKTSFPPQEDVILLHSIRPFILQNERFYLIKIINILSFLQK